MLSIDQNINNTFFEGSYKDIWRKIIPSGLSEAEADFIQDTGSLQPGQKVLDIMCGYGRHAIELAKRGYQVTAIDNLKEYIQEIKSTAEAKNLPVEVILSDALKVNIQDTYDAAICMGNSFSFFSREESLMLLTKISSHLKTGGVFIINSWMVAEIAIKYFREKDWYYVGDYKCLLDYKYCFNPSRIESEQTIIARDGAIEVIKGIDYIFTLNELEEMFREAGMRTAGLFSTPRKKKFVMGDSRIYIVAEKFR